jgi:hypothetical protein
LNHLIYPSHIRKTFVRIANLTKSHGRGGGHAMARRATPLIPRLRNHLQIYRVSNVSQNASVFVCTVFVNKGICIFVLDTAELAAIQTALLAREPITEFDREIRGALAMVFSGS